MNDGGQAFPCPGRYDGMALRDYFAAAAMQGMCANPSEGDIGTSTQDCAELAYKYADAMLKAREGGES